MPRTGGAKRIRLVVSDVDGTLVTTEKALTQPNIDAVALLHAAKIQFAVVSSRPPRGMAMLVEPLKITTAIAGFNGGALVEPDQTPIELHPVPEAAVRTALDVFARAGIDAWVFADGEWLLTNPDGAYVPKEKHTVLFDPKLVPDFEPYVARVGKVVGSTRDFALLARIESELHETLGATANAHRSQQYYLDVTHPDANKGFAARRLCAHLGVPLEETACIGDMTNDVPMLDIAGFAIAMGNAPEAVQAHAHAVTGENDTSGFAQAVERYILPRAG